MKQGFPNSLIFSQKNSLVLGVWLVSSYMSPDMTMKSALSFASSTILENDLKTESYRRFPSPGFSSVTA